VAGQLNIRRSWTQSGIVEDTKTSAGTRTVAAPASLVSATPGAPDALVIGMSPNAADKQWRRMMADLGMSHHMHMIRHSVASRMIADGVPITNVSTQLGHANPAITFGIYSHATEEHAPGAIEW
jgi:integrase